MIREGTDAVVVNGTTGESATLDDKEKMAVIRYAVRQVDGRIPVIAGTGEQLYGACGGAVQKGPGAGGGCPAAGDAPITIRHPRMGWCAILPRWRTM